MIFPKLTADKITEINGVKISEFLLKNHNLNNIDLPYKRTKKLLGVTIHNTDDLDNVADDPEQLTRATLNGNMRTVRVHYYVDDLGAWQNLPLEYVNWTCTDGNGDGNTATIAIECVMDGQTGAENTAAMDNCARLAAWLLHNYGLSADDLYTHSFWLHVRDGHCSKDVSDRDYWCTKPHSYKTCPYYIIPQWAKFKALVKKYYDALKNEKPPDNTEKIPENNSGNFLVKVIDPALNIREAPGVGNKIVGVITDCGVYTITETKPVGTGVWGKLKSGIGWVNIGEKYCRRV